MADVTQIFGALLVLAAFAALQAGWLTGKSVPYLLGNLVGSAILAVLAYADQQWGFLLLEGTWAAISAWSLSAPLRQPRRRLHGDSLAAAPGELTCDR